MYTNDVAALGDLLNAECDIHSGPVQAGTGYRKCSDGPECQRAAYSVVHRNWQMT